VGSQTDAKLLAESFRASIDELIPGFECTTLAPAGLSLGSHKRFRTMQVSICQENISSHRENQVPNH